MHPAHDTQVPRVGPAGWSYEDWKGIVYPTTMPRKTHALEWLSQWFDTVEINVSFYRPVTARMSAAWPAKVLNNPRFRFTAKVWQRFTHDDAPLSQTDLAEFRAGMDPLAEAGRLGALLIQFPWSFRRTPENRQRLARIIAALKSYPLAVEVRHDSWVCEEYLDALRAEGVAFCNIDQPEHDHGIQPTAHITAPLAYIRLHGRNRAAWFNQKAPSYERYNYLYDQQELRPWLDRIQSVSKQAQDTYVVTNNHYQGKAVANAIELIAALGRSPHNLPDELLDAYPQLRRVIETHDASSEHP